MYVVCDNVTSCKYVNSKTHYKVYVVCHIHSSRCLCHHWWCHMDWEFKWEINSLYCSSSRQLTSHCLCENFVTPITPNMCTGQQAVTSEDHPHLSELKGLRKLCPQIPVVLITFCVKLAVFFLNCACKKSLFLVESYMVCYGLVYTCRYFISVAGDAWKMTEIKESGPTKRIYTTNKLVLLYQNINTVK